MNTIICTLDALKQAAEIHRSVRFAYIRTANVEISSENGVNKVPEDALNTGVSIVPEDTKFSQSAFVIMHEGQAVAYDNVCPHRSTELDWNPGDVFDETGLYLICATHGAMFQPNTGLCVAGPCTKQRLRKLALRMDETGVFLA